MKTLTLDQLQALLSAGDAVLLEALPAMYYEADHLPGAKNLPLDDIETLAPQLVPDKTTTVVTYCTGLTCPNSKIAAGRLEALGYLDVRVFEGGKEQWLEAGLAFEAGVNEAVG
ncbi:MAG: sulfurtransferase [Acidimicrobiia bacterium]|nr:sulfurtransferase [Acidimicrobiia bacterium]